jgi:PAS domain S-box-containing protein
VDPIKSLFSNGYAVAVLATFAILLVLESLQPIFGDSPPLLLFLVAIMFAGWSGGFRAGLLATALSTLASAYFLEEPYDSLYIAEDREQLRVALLIGVGMLLSLVIAHLRTVERQALHEVLEQKAQLKDEVEEHRKTEKRRSEAEEALRQSNEELTGLFNAVPIPVWIALDARCNTVTGNPAAAALLGIDATANAIGRFECRARTDIICRRHGIPLAPDELPLQRAIATGRPVEETELEVVFPAGKRHYLTGRAAPLFDRNGSPRGAVAALADITDLVQDFVHCETRFHAFMDNSPAVSWMKDEQGRYAYLSRTYQQRMRVRLEGWLGKTDFELWPREIAEQFQKSDREALARGKPVEIFEEAPDADGKHCCWWIFKFPFEDAAGNKFVGGVGLDITERKRIEGALQSSEALNRAILDSLLEHVAVVDRKGNILAVNQAWQRFARENSPEPGAPVPGTQVGANYLEACRDSSGAVPAEASPAYTGILSVLRGERESFTLEYPCHAPDRERWFVMQATPLRAPPGAAVISHTNITERKQAERVLSESNRRKTEFLAMLGHELRNPLAPIRNAVQIMRKVDVNHPRMLWARDVVDRQVDHLARLVDDLLDVSRIVQGKLALHKAPLDIATVIQRAIETSQPAIETHHHALFVSMPDEPMPLEGDCVRLTQVVSNLLNNAAKYTRQGGRIWLTAAREGGEAVISVRDTGEGIPSTLLPHLFDIFTQAQRTLDRSQGGLGLGLTIVRTIVEMHGGRVTVRSDGPGKGSEFIVRLPLREG